MRSILMLVLGMLTLGGSTALADSLDSVVMQKIDRDHKLEVQRGTFARQKAVARATIASKGGAGRSIASEGGAKAAISREDNAARILEHEMTGPTKAGEFGKTAAKTVAIAPAAIVKKAAAVKAAAKPTVAKR